MTPATRTTAPIAWIRENVALVEKNQSPLMTLYVSPADGSGRTHLEAIPLIRHLLSGALDTRQFVESGKNRLTSRGSVATVGHRGSESPFDICLTRRERDAEVLHVVEEFSLNRDQARLLWRCARWFRPSETARTDQRGDEEMEAEEKGEEDQDQDTGPVLLVHGVFGEL